MVKWVLKQVASVLRKLLLVQLQSVDKGIDDASNGVKMWAEAEGYEITRNCIW